MITLYDPRPEGATLAQPSSQQASRRCPPEAFLNEIEAKRYDFLAEQFREMDRPVLAQMCQNWAKEHRLTIAKLALVDERIAKLDATLARGRAAE